MGAMTRSFSYHGVRGIAVDNLGSGSIVVEPNPTSGAVDGTLDADERVLQAVTVRHDGGQLRIGLPASVVRSGHVDLRLSVPPGLTYALKSGSADISISADVGRAKISSGSGDVSLEQADELDCTTGSGSIAVHRLTGRAARLGTGSGDIRVGEAYGQVSAKSGSGDIVVEALHRELSASSGSGDIAVPAARGSVELRSASGSLSVGIADGLPAWLDLSSVTGPVTITLEPSTEPAPGEPYVRVQARTASGGIAVFRA
jgi:Putative adhesin